MTDGMVVPLVGGKKCQAHQDQRPCATQPQSPLINNVKWGETREF